MKIILEDELVELLKQQLKEQQGDQVTYDNDPIYPDPDGDGKPDVRIPQMRYRLGATRGKDGTPTIGRGHSSGVEQYRKAVSDAGVEMPPASIPTYYFMGGKPKTKKQTIDDQKAIEQYNIDLAAALERLKTFKPQPASECRLDIANMPPGTEDLDPGMPDEVRAARGTYATPAGIDPGVVGPHEAESQDPDSPKIGMGYIGCQRLRDRQGNTFYVNFRVKNPMEQFVISSHLFIMQTKNGVKIPEKINPDAIVGIKELPENIRKVFDKLLMNYGYDIAHVTKLLQDLDKEMKRMIAEGEELLDNAMIQVGRERRGSISSGGDAARRREFDNPDRAEDAKYFLRQLITIGPEEPEIRDRMRQYTEMGSDETHARGLATKDAIESVLKEYNISKKSFERLRIGQVKQEDLMKVINAVKEYKQKLQDLDVLVGAQSIAKLQERQKLEQLLERVVTATKLNQAARFFNELQRRLMISDAYEIRQIIDLEKKARQVVNQYRLNQGLGNLKQLQKHLDDANMNLSTAQKQRAEFLQDRQEIIRVMGSKEKALETGKFDKRSPLDCGKIGMIKRTEGCVTVWPDVVTKACSYQRQIVNQFTGECVDKEAYNQKIYQAQFDLTNYRNVPELEQEINKYGGAFHEALMYRRLQIMGVAPEIDGGIWAITTGAHRTTEKAKAIIKQAKALVRDNPRPEEPTRGTPAAEVKAANRCPDRHVPYADPRTGQILGCIPDDSWEDDE